MRLYLRLSYRSLPRAKDKGAWFSAATSRAPSLVRSDVTISDAKQTERDAVLIRSESGPEKTERGAALYRKQAQHFFEISKTSGANVIHY